MPQNLEPVWNRCVNRLQISPHGCWEWQGCKSKDGYGRVATFGTQQRLVHVVSYFHHCGPVPDDLVIAHKCHNTSCCNPVHLEAITQKKNVQQSIERGTFAFCRRQAKLTPKQRTAIQREYNGTAHHQQQLAEQYGVSIWLIRKIIYREKQEAML